MFKLLHTFAVLAVVCCNAFAANDWPTKPVKMITLSAPGSAPDIITRLVAAKLTASWGQQVIVDNRAGAGGIVGMSAVKESPSDGYTFVMAHAAAIAITPHLVKNPRYDVDKDLAPVALVGVGPMMIVANPKFKANTIPELIALARSEKDPINMAVTGQFSVPYLTAELIQQLGNVSFNIVPFRSPGDGLTAVMGGDTQLMIDGIPGMRKMVKEGRVKPLAVTSRDRLQKEQSIPALAETFKGIEVNGWFATYTRQGVPQSIIDKVNADIRNALHDQVIIERLEDLGVFAKDMTIDQVKTFTQAERQLWSKVIKDARIEAK